MTLVTDRITYNVGQRGRKHRGVDRVFDTVALAKLINSPSTQERVKAGDMLGYFGHWPRVKFGMDLREGAILDGKSVVLPLALRTTELSADDAGNITHRAEFLDTDAGQVAAQLYQSKAGGFSSAIDAVPRTSPYIPRGFHGFDYVLEPNYNTNRGHRVVLDGVAPEMASLLDGLMEQAAREQDEMVAVFDSLHAQHLDALVALERTAAERDELLDMVARLTGKRGQQVLDSVLGVEAIGPDMVTPADPSQWTQYRDVPLASLAGLPKEPTPDTPESRYAQQRFGVRV